MCKRLIEKESQVIRIDGAQGEGGGQILRSALSLSMCLNQPVSIENIRSGRNKPGLLRQHLTCVKAAQAITQADVEGDQLGSQCVLFKPGKIQAGGYRFSIGTAGSTALVFQTVLPALLLADDISHVSFDGGTHNKMAPSFDFLFESFVPVLKTMGMHIEGQLERYGFYPHGGGQWQTKIQPLKNIEPLNLLSRGVLEKRKAVACSARIPKHVIERELETIQKHCDWPENELHREFVNAYGPGNILSLRIKSRFVTEVIEEVGEFGLPAERVARKAIKTLKRYMDAEVPVGDKLCDQLLIPMVIGEGGCFKTLKPSQHTLTNIDVIRQMTGHKVEIKEIERDCVEIRINKRI